MPLQGKKQKESKDAQPDAKKRKSSSSASATKGKGSSRKEKFRKTKKPLSRRVSPMPRLDEEANDDKEHHRVAQADIDSRCYELTVKPLADVSQAYEQSSSFQIAHSCNDNIKFRPVKVSFICTPAMWNARSYLTFLT